MTNVPLPRIPHFLIFLVVSKMFQKTLSRDKRERVLVLNIKIHPLMFDFPFRWKPDLRLRRQ